MSSKIKGERDATTVRSFRACRRTLNFTPTEMVAISTMEEWPDLPFLVDSVENKQKGGRADAERRVSR